MAHSSVMTGGTVGDIGEHRLIELIHARLTPPPASVKVGIGDDAAVVEPARNQLLALTTDALIEGVHFDRSVASGIDIGYKALAVNLSDLAAMGATPQYALLSLALPSSLELTFVNDLLEGMNQVALQTPTRIVGGNVARSTGPVFIDVTMVGAVGKRRVLTRSGARPGDHLYVSGELGAAAAALRTSRPRGAFDPREGRAVDWQEAWQRLMRPPFRLRLGVLLGRNRAATACIDLSDGLADAVRQVCLASGCGAVIESDRIPVARSARQLLGDAQAIDVALSGGEDYELLFTVSPRHLGRLRGVKRLLQGLPITRIGEVTTERTLLQRDGSTQPLPEGFTHFGKRTAQEVDVKEGADVTAS